MINIKSYASGSKGNLYLVSNKDTNIILECGVDKNLIYKMLNDNNLTYKNINACLTSHCHQDHSISIKLFDNYNIKCYCTYETKIKYNLNDDNFIQLIDNKKYIINSIQFISISVFHGDTENYGFIFKDNDSLVLFITDFMLLKKDLSSFKFDKIYIECNYIEDLRKDKEIINENENYKKLIRQLNTHMELSNLLIHLDNFDLTNCDEINLIHISEEVGDREVMKKTIEQEYGIECYCLLANGDKV